MGRTLLITVVLSALLAATIEYATAANQPRSSYVLAPFDDSDTVYSEARRLRKLGAYVSVFEPFPAVAGGGLAFNVTDWFQANLAIGFGSDGAVDYIRRPVATRVTSPSVRFFIPGWGFSPYLGLGYSFVRLDGRAELAGQTVRTRFPTASFGIAWQALNGFNLNFGVIAPLTRNPSLTELYGRQVDALPTLSVGWFL